MKAKKLSRRGFVELAAVTGGALVIGGVARQLHNQAGRNFKPERGRAYLDSLQPSPAPHDLPNIIIVLCDDLGRGDLHSPVIDTSNLQRMARQGTTLSNFYASASVCSPSRAGFLTGRYPVRTLISTPLLSNHNPLNVVMDVLGRYSYNVRGIPTDEILLSEALQRRGYHTGLVGKWHLGGTDGYLPNDRGFDEFYGAWWSNDDQPYAIYRNRQVEIPAPADQDSLTYNFTQEAIQFIKSSQGQPFFLYLAHAMPHFPVHASATFQGKSGAGRYGDAIEEIDWSVGEVLNSVAQLDIDERTLVIFTCDHGPWMQGSPGDVRGRKLQWFEGGFRVPFIARWPGVIPPGKVNPGVAANLDLFSTCMALAGLALPEDRIIDGKDLLPLLKGEAASPRDAFFFYDTRKVVAVRHQQWKYIRRTLTDIATYWPTRQGPFLFNLESDPTESYSMIEAEPAVSARLASMLDEFEAGMEINLRGWL